MRNSCGVSENYATALRKCKKYEVSSALSTAESDVERERFKRHERCRKRLDSSDDDIEPDGPSASHPRAKVGRGAGQTKLTSKPPIPAGLMTSAYAGVLICS